jgi:uncharacterized membrane protein YiaA
MSTTLTLELAAVLTSLSLLLRASRDTRGAVTPSAVLAAAKSVGWLAVIALFIAGAVGLWALVLAESLRVLVMLATGVALVLAAIACHVVRLLDGPSAPALGA